MNSTTRIAGLATVILVAVWLFGMIAWRSTLWLAWLALGAAILLSTAFVLRGN